MSQPIRQILRHVRHTPDRLLHSTRRRRALANLGRWKPRSIGFVCFGNICRSPYALGVAQSALMRFPFATPRLWSGGLSGPGRPSPDTAIRAAQERGIDLTQHRSRPLPQDRKDGFDWIFVMETWQAAAVREWHSSARIVLLGDLDPLPIDTRAIPDPIDRPLEVFRRCYDRIDRCIRSVVDGLA